VIALNPDLWEAERRALRVANSRMEEVIVYRPGTYEQVRFTLHHNEGGDADLRSNVYYDDEHIGSIREFYDQSWSAVSAYLPFAAVPKGGFPTRNSALIAMVDWREKVLESRR